MDWQEYFSDNNRRLVSTFVLYLFAVLVFSVVYQIIYTKNPGSFAFNADIQSAQSANFKVEAEKQNVTFRLELQALKQILDKMKTISDPVETVHINKGLLGDDVIQFQTDDYKLIFRLKAVGASIDGLPLITMEAELYDAKNVQLAVHEAPGDPVFTQRISQYRDMVLRLVAEIEENLSENERRLLTIGGPAPDVWSYWDFLYFSIMTQTSVGYGDILPNNTTVRMIVSAQVLCGLLLLVVIINLVIQKVRAAAN